MSRCERASMGRQLGPVGRRLKDSVLYQLSRQLVDHMSVSWWWWWWWWQIVLLPPSATTPAVSLNSALNKSLETLRNNRNKREGGESKQKHAERPDWISDVKWYKPWGRRVTWGQMKAWWETEGWSLNERHYSWKQEVWVTFRLRTSRPRSTATAADGSFS